MSAGGRYDAGDRVGALLSANDTVVKLLGYGVYEGDHPCPMLGGMKNPRIRLDAGDTVWGMQCWWGPEDRIKKEVADRVERGATIEKVQMS